MVGTCLLCWTWFLGTYHAHLLARQDRMGEYSTMTWREFLPQLIKFQLQTWKCKAVLCWFHAVTLILLFARDLKLNYLLACMQNDRYQHYVNYILTALLLRETVQAYMEFQNFSTLVLNRKWHNRTKLQKYAGQII